MKESKSPQLENGYTRIANEIMDELCRFRMAGEARQVLDFIIRKTWGFNKKEDKISNSQIVEGTGLSKGRASLYLSQLIIHRIVTKSGNKLCLNKDYSKWVSFKKLPKVVTNKSLPKVVTPVTKSGNKSLPSLGDTIDNKDNIQKTYARKSFFTSLTEKEIDNLITSQRVSPSVVQDYMAQADEWSNGGGNKKLSWYITIRGWIRRDIKSGKLKQNLTQEEELELEAKKIGFTIK